MEQEICNTQKYPEIVEVLNSALPDDEITQWLTLAKTKGGNFAIMGQASNKVTVDMIIRFIRHSGLLRSVLDALYNELNK